MSPTPLKERLAKARELIQSISESVAPQDLLAKADELESETGNPEFWADAQRAQTITSQIASFRRLANSVLQNRSAIEDLSGLAEIALLQNDSDAIAEIETELAKVEKELADLEVETLLSGEYDSRGAVVTIRSGAGGDDATDFAEMLLRMYLRFCEKKKWPSRVLDTSFAEGAGIKSATFEVDASYAFGNLSVESGTHRLVRMSPFNAAGKRQTSFAAVEVVPLVAATEEISIPDSDIRVDVFRSSGPGGQSVNTTDSAVRITHVPSGIVVSCQNEKSQLQNKQAALRVLQSRLLEIKRQEEEAKKKQIAGDVKASWGEQMRSYVLAPYQMVKDLRTNYEVNNPTTVFDGDLEGFISAGIRWRAAKKS